MIGIKLGKASLQRTGPVEAGSYQTVKFTYTAGHPVDDAGYVKIVFRFAGDFGEPQFNNPSAPNYCSIRTTGNCAIIPRWDKKGHTRPWGKALYLKITKGFLGSGQKIIIVFGDKTHGSPGWQMQTFCENTLEFKTLVDPIATYEFKPLLKSPVLKIVPGKPVRARCIAPSAVKVKRSFYYYFKLEDRWGNPTGRPKKIKYPGFSRPGIYYIQESDKRRGLKAKSNPVAAVADASVLYHYWADFHGQSEETIGTNSIRDYFTFARDYGLVDISAHQGNDFQVTDSFWHTVNQQTKSFYRQGRFVTYPGYEWSGNTPLGGDRNIYFVSEGGRISRSCRDLLPKKHSKFPDSPTARDLFQNLKKQRIRAFGFAHVGGRYADLRMHHPDIELAVEIHSAWGTFEWIAEDAFKLGLRVGICANSDGHKCRPGASYPGAGLFGSLGGLTCVLAQKLDRKNIYEALKARHFYATTGNRPLMDVRLITKDGQSAMMGDVIRPGKSASQLLVVFAGTGPVENIEVRQGRRILKTFYAYEKKDLGKRIKVVWEGAEVRGRARMVRWDGHLRVKGNRIRGVVPVNFWKPDRPLCRQGVNRISWQSITTGGVCGAILDLDSQNAGLLEMETAQGKVRTRVQSIGLKPKVFDFGGLNKRIRIYRLPQKVAPALFCFKLTLDRLVKGDNPLYIRAVQEDGHMAWSSPIYVIK
jgi:hypothetical protein